MSGNVRAGIPVILINTLHFRTVVRYRLMFYFVYWYTRYLVKYFVQA